MAFCWAKIAATKTLIVWEERNIFFCLSYNSNLIVFSINIFINEKEEQEQEQKKAT